MDPVMRFGFLIDTSCEDKPIYMFSPTVTRKLYEFNGDLTDGSVSLPIEINNTGWKIILNVFCVDNELVFDLRGLKNTM